MGMNSQSATDNSKGGSQDSNTGSGNQRQQEPTLDELLAQWDEPNKGGKGGGNATQQQTKQTGPESGQQNVDELRKELDTVKSHLAEQTYQQAMDQVIPTIRGDFNVEDSYVEWWVNQKADQDPRLQELWNQRTQKPQEFQQAMEALGRDFQQNWREKTHQSEQETRRRASTAAFASSSTNPGSNDDRIADELAGLNDRDFALRKQEIFRSQASG